MKLPYCSKATKKKYVIWQIRAKITKRQKSANKRKPLLVQTPTKNKVGSLIEFLGLDKTTNQVQMQFLTSF